MVQRRGNRPDTHEMNSDESIPLGRIVRTIILYRHPILLSVGAVMLLYGVIMTAIFVFGPSQKIASVPFRLEFSGASIGQYPNGTRFAPNDIVGTPILLRVYEANDLSRFLPFRTFADALFILESNEELEALALQYRARLSDLSLTTVDRERIQEEYRQKRESLSRSDYSINLTIDSETRSIPRSLATKVLDQILREWADYAREEKGATRYQTVLLTENIISRQQILEEDPIIATDILRSKIKEVIRNIDQLHQIPGAQVLRAGDNNISLAELKVQLEDLIRFRLSPLLIETHSGVAHDTDRTTRFLQAQLTYNERRYEEGTARVARLREALETYQREGHPTRGGTSSIPLTGRGTAGGDIVMPQLSETFLEQIVDLSGLNADREYRQGLVDEIKWASMETLPFESEVHYYQNINDFLAEATDRPSGSELELSTVKVELRTILSELLTAIQDVNAIYELISTNINASGSLYRVTEPPTMSVSYGISPVRLVLIGILVFMVALPTALAGALLHNRFGEDGLQREGDVEGG